MKNMDVFEPATQQEKDNIIKDLTKNTAAFGIDLGTTNSAISVIPRGTAPVIISLKGGRSTIPSCVMWLGGDNFIVGKEAYEQRYRENCCYSVKRFMQDPKALITLVYNGEKKIMTPAEVSAEILKGLVAETGDVYGDIKDVVITVPAKFNEIGRSNTKKAAELAGLNVLGIIAEPTAASMCYELKPTDGGNRDLLVYDLGGGTFDVSLVRVTGEQDYSKVEDVYGIPEAERRVSTKTTIRAIDGDGNVTLGGDDIDREIYNNCIKELEERGCDVSHISTEEENRLILLIEQLKKSDIHSITQLHFHLGNDETYEVVSLNYDSFKAGLLPTYNKTKTIVNEVLKRNRNSSTDTIVLVGGSTKNPILKELLEKDYPGYEINDAFPQDEAVALGAGIHSRFLKYGDNNISVFDSLIDSIGVDSSDKMSVIIPRGSQFPVTKFKLYETSEDDQAAIDVDILQGNSSVAAENCKLGTMVIDNLPKGKAGTVDIRIQLSINVRGLLKCSVTITKNDEDISKREVINREMSLELSSGNAPTEKLSKDEKLKIKWRAFARNLKETDASEFLQMVDAYPNNHSLADIQQKMKELRNVCK